MAHYQIKCKQILRENNLYAHSTIEAIQVPKPLQASILQWHNNTLQHPKRMQAMLRENFYWLVVDAAIELLVKACEMCQKCKLTAVKNTLTQQYQHCTLGRSTC